MLNNIAALIGTSAAVVGDYQSISTVTVGAGGSTSIDFTSIPATYSHLQVRCIARASTGGATDYNALRMQFNGDTASNYRVHYLYGTGAAAGSGAIAAGTYLDNIGLATGSANTANTFAVSVIDILDYTSTNKNKTVRSLNATESNNTVGYIELTSGLWFATPAAITSIKITASPTIGQYSSFALYGIK